MPNERTDLIALTAKLPVALRHQVFRHGRLLFARSLEHLVPLRVATAREWGDGQRRRQESWQVFRRNLEARAWSKPQ